MQQARAPSRLADGGGIRLARLPGSLNGARGRRRLPVNPEASWSVGGQATQNGLCISTSASVRDTPISFSIRSSIPANA